MLNAPVTAVNVQNNAITCIVLMSSRGFTSLMHSNHIISTISAKIREKPAAGVP